MQNTSQWNNVLASVGITKERLQKESIIFTFMNVLYVLSLI